METADTSDVNIASHVTDTCCAGSSFYHPVDRYVVRVCLYSKIAHA